MNFSTPQQNYDLIPQPSPNMNNIGPQYQQNMTYNQGYPFNYHHPIYNNYGPYGYYNTMVSYNPDTSNNVNHSTKTKAPEKRESKPLTVIDPNKNEVIDFSKITKSKNSSLLDEIQPANNPQSIIPDLSINSTLLNQVQHEDPEELGQTLIEPDILNEVMKIKEECKEFNTKSSLSTSLSMKQSHSIPHEMDSLLENKLNRQISSSSESDLHQKSNLSFNNLEEIFNNERKIYNRDSLVAIGKCPRSLLPPFSLDNFECQEIISKEINDIPKTLENKMLGMPNRKGYNQRVINFGSPKSGSLSRLKNGYLTPHLRIKEECSTNKQLDSYRRNLKCILNKIAPQNFDLCIAEIKGIIKESEIVNIVDCIDCLIEEIFDKAVKEEAYSVTYANLCVKIANFDQQNDSKWNFKSSLLTRCKEMFDTPLQDQLKSVKEHWEKKIEEEVDEKLRNIYSADIDEQVKRARDKYFGNIRFIGELYMHDLLKPKIIHSCVQSLMPKTTDEDAMLSLCKLIETCGKKFDEHHTDKMKEIITSMIKIYDNCSLETRIRYRVLDIIEMSDRKWSLRKIQAQKMIRPKTLEEVKNDDIEDKAIAISKYPSKSQNRTLSMKVPSSNELKFKNTQNGNQSIELNSLSVAQNESFNLKPCCSWTSNSKEKDFTEWHNVDNKKGAKKYQSLSGKNNTKHKSKPGKQMDDSPRKKQTQGKFAQLMNDDDTNESSLPSNSPVREASPYENKIDDDIMPMDKDGLLDDLLQSKILNVDSWCRQKNVGEVISHWLDRIMEKDKASRNLVGDKLANLISCNKLSKEELIEGVIQFVDMVDELIPDIPKIWLFLAEFLERFIQNRQSDVEFYKTIFDKRPDKEFAECIIMILEYATDRVGIALILDIVDKPLRSLMESVIIHEGITKQIHLRNLNFLLPSMDDKYSNSFKSQLISMFANDLENVYLLLDSKFTLAEMQTETYVDFIANCLFSFICDLSEKAYVINFIVEKETFFIRLINGKSEFEAQILLVLCSFAKLLQKKDLLLTVIQNLSGKKLISNDAFYTFIQATEDKSIHMGEINVENFVIMVEAIRSSSLSDRR